MTARAAFDDMLMHTKQLVARHEQVRGFMGDLLEDLPFAQQSPLALPFLPQLAQCAALCSPQTQALTQAIVRTGSEIHWKQSYTKAQVGAQHLANYGWFNLVSPEGAFVSADCRVSVGFWAQGLSYPHHRHLPEEIYCVLAGGAMFHTEGRAPVDAVPDTLIHHPSDISHGMEMQTAPLLAIAFWKGANLLAFSRLEPEQ